MRVLLFTLVGMSWGACASGGPERESTDPARAPTQGPVATARTPAESLARMVFHEGVVEERPELLRMGPLPLPDSLRRAGARSETVLEFIVDTLGRAEASSIRVIRATDSAFVDEAVALLKTAEFRPGRALGRNVRVLVQMPVRLVVPETGRP